MEKLPRFQEWRISKTRTSEPLLKFTTNISSQEIIHTIYYCVDKPLSECYKNILAILFIDEYGYNPDNLVENTIRNLVPDLSLHVFIDIHGNYEK